LEVERVGKDVRSRFDCKGGRDDIQPGGEERKKSDHYCNCKGVGKTYLLEERKGKRSDHGYNCRGGMDDVLPGEGEKRGQIKVVTARGQGQRTAWKRDQVPGCDCRRGRDDAQTGDGEGRKRGQITVVTERGRDDERPEGGRKRGKRSYHSCECKGGKDDVQPEGGEKGKRGHITVKILNGVGMTYSLEKKIRSRLRP
jgi:hypothetical protein